MQAAARDGGVDEVDSLVADYGCKGVLGRENG